MQHGVETSYHEKLMPTESIKTNQGERKLARGTLYNIISKTVYLSCAYVIHASLGRVLGPEEYGIFGTVFALFNILYLFLTAGIPSSVSKHIAGDKTIAYSVTKVAVRTQLISASLVSVAVFGGAEFFASAIFNDTELSRFIRMAALTVIPIALLYVYVGALLGTRQFPKEALLLIFRAIVRAIVVLGMVLLLGLGLDGAIYGYVFAAIFGMVVVGSFCRFPKSEIKFDVRKLIYFAVPLTLSAGTVSLLLNMDIILIKRIVGYNNQVGFYTAAATVSHLLYYIGASFAATLLPSIAGSYHKNETWLVKKYILQSTRYLLIILVPIVVVICATSGNILELVYGERFLAASQPLSVLAIGLGFFSLTMVLSTVIIALGHPWISTSILAVTVVLNLVLNYILISRYGILGAAVATTASHLFSMLITGLYVMKKTNAVIQLVSLVKIMGTGAFIYLTARLLPFNGLMLPVLLVLLFLLYFAVLFILREFQTEDYDVVRGILGKKLMPSQWSGAPL